MAKFLNYNRLRVATPESVHFFAYCEGKIYALTKTERHQLESGLTLVARVASVALVIELILLR
jgi:hypothetical protein